VRLRKEPEPIPVVDPGANTAKTEENAEGARKIDVNSTIEVRTETSIGEDRDHDAEFKPKPHDGPSGNSKPNNSKENPKNEAPMPAVKKEGH
jgi:hypothetical protein